MPPRRIRLAPRTIKVIERPGCDYPAPRFHEPDWRAHECWCNPEIVLRADDEVTLQHRVFDQ